MRNDDDCFNNGAGLRPAALQLDPDKYRSELDGFDMTEEQKNELLATFWSIMRDFVELGFSVDVCAAVFDDANSVPSDDRLN